MRILATYRIGGIIKVQTGLHIGSGIQTFSVGGIDSFVIKTPAGLPYIPGSSLKGKLRSELEWKHGMVNTEKDRIISEYNQNHPNALYSSLSSKEEQIKVLSKVKECNCGTCKVCKLFGHKNTKEIRLERAIFRDNFIRETTVQCEEKYENTISRITSDATPRCIERVPINTQFDLRIVFKTYEPNDIDLLCLLFDGLKLIEDSFLGGGGSRGNGQVSFSGINIFKVPSSSAIINEKNPSEIITDFLSIKSNL